MTSDDRYPELLTVELFAALFEGNADRYGAEEGGSLEIDADWFDLAELHLTGEIEPIGVYPIDPTNGLCKWGCIDFDLGDEESLVHAVNVANMLQCEGIKTWIERSRSKGFHVWVFCKEWVQPTVMRPALLYACDFMGAPTTEINPKQLLLHGEQVGNYMRLPYPGHLCDYIDNNVRGNRRVMIDVTTANDVPLDRFVRSAWENRTPIELLEPLANRWVQHEVAEINALPAISETVKETIDSDLWDRLPPSAKKLLQDGPGYDDRSAALCYLAGHIARDRPQITEEECKEVIAWADIQWGKYEGRPDADIRLDEIIQRVYGERDSFY